MQHIDELIERLEELTDRLILSGTDNVTEGTWELLQAARLQLEEAGMVLGSKLVADFIQQAGANRRSFEQVTGIYEAFMRLQAFIDAAREVRERELLRRYYGLVD